MKTKYERKGKSIKNIETGKRKVYPSVNKAKRESWKLQMDRSHESDAPGYLGSGFVKRI